MLLSKKPFFPFRTSFNIMCRSFFKENETRKKFQIFEENHGLTPLKKCTFAHCVKMTFLQSRKPCFCILNIIKHHIQVFFRDFETQTNFQIFVENHGLTPVEKWTFAYYVKMKYCYLKSLFFPVRTSFNIMCRSFSKKMRLRRISNF